MKHLLAAILSAITFLIMAFSPSDGQYIYDASVTSVHDGDTLKADISLGLDVWIHNQAVRLAGLDAPEVKGLSRVAGFASRDYLVGLLAGHKVKVETIGDEHEKYGRLIGNIWIQGSGDWCPKDTWCLVNEQMIKSGHATRKIY